MALDPRINGSAPSIRRLARMGWSADAIARLYRITRDELRAILYPPPAPAPRPRPTADELAALRAPRQSRDRPLSRPRSRRELGALAEWSRFNDDDLAGPEMPAAVAVELPELVPVERQDPAEIPAAAPAESWESWHASNVAGPDSANARLSAADARRARELRAKGLTIRELSERFEVSVATMKRLLRGDTYADVAPPAEIPAPGPTATRPSPKPKPGAPKRSDWKPEAARTAAGRWAKGAERRDDLVTLPGPPIADPPPAVEYPAVAYDDWGPDPAREYD
jgi:hypothetical protein